MANILVLCTANQCRSPLAAAMLRRTIAERGLEHKVKSAGLLHGGEPSPEQIVEVAHRHDLDLSAHRSTQATVELLEGADLVLGMTRHHVRDVAVMEPTVWPVAFTMNEWVRRSERVGGKPAGVSVEDWCAMLHEGRTTTEMLAASASDDIVDPMGGTFDDFLLLGTTLAVVVEQVADNL
jgi:protein-tyrosine phosphatase